MTACRLIPEVYVGGDGGGGVGGGGSGVSGGGGVEMGSARQWRWSGIMAVAVALEWYYGSSAVVPASPRGQFQIHSTQHRYGHFW